MAKPKQNTKSLPKQDLSSRNILAGYEKYFLPVLLSVTFICFFPSLQNKFTNLDDTQYFIDNPVVKNLNAESIKTVFSDQFVGNYQPLTMLTYLIDYQLFGMNPFGWHLENLVLYLLTVLLVFLIIERLSGNKQIAFLTSLLFGLHPLHVESVAWVSERKDVLYGFFFLWALYMYVLHKKQQQAFNKYFLLSLLFFVCSILSKAQAVVLPVVFFGVDFLMGRGITKKSLMEKVPFFLLAFAFGLIAITVQGKAGAMQTFKYFPFHERLLFSCYALMTYFHKLILPVNLSCFYPYPETDDKINTVWVYLSPGVLLVIAFLIWKFFRTSRVVLFGVFFFLATIALVLQLLPVGDALYADRYTYLPSMGLFFIAAHYFNPYLKNKMAVALAAGCLLIFGYLTFQRNRVWHDSLTLYTDAIDNGYKAAIIYNNRGAVLSDSGMNAEALKDFTDLVALKPKYPNGWRNKGLVHERLGQKEEAIHAYGEELKNHPGDTKTYLSRGTLLQEKNDFEGAAKDFSKIIELKPDDGEGYYARAEAYGRSGRIAEALTDINKCIELAPDNGQAYNNRGIIFSMSGKYQEAINDFTRSLQLKPDNLGAYTNRALAYKSLGKFSEALQDMIMAKEKGISVNENEMNELRRLSGNQQAPIP